MAEKTKYGKYFIEYDPKDFPKERRPVMVRMQESVMKGSHFYLVHWVMPDFAKPLGDVQVRRPPAAHS